MELDTCGYCQGDKKIWHPRDELGAGDYVNCPRCLGLGLDWSSGKKSMLSEARKRAAIELAILDIEANRRKNKKGEPSS